MCWDSLEWNLALFFLVPCHPLVCPSFLAAVVSLAWPFLKVQAWQLQDDPVGIIPPLAMYRTKDIKALVMVADDEAALIVLAINKIVSGEVVERNIVQRTELENICQKAARGGQGNIIFIISLHLGDIIIIFAALAVCQTP